MRFSLITLCLCFFVSIPLAASQIEHAMINNWKSKKFRRAIRAEKNIERVNEHGETYLHIAVRLNRPEHLAILIEERPLLLEQFMRRDQFPQTALELAILLNHIEPFRVLLKHLRIPNFRIWNRYKWTLMHLAARYDRDDFIQELARAGANVNPFDQTSEQWTPLDVALHFGRTRAAEALRLLGGQIHALDIANELPVQNLVNQQVHFLDEDDEFGEFRMPLSDFSFGPMAIRIAFGAFFVCLLIKQAIPFGSY